LSAYAEPGQVIGACYEDPPLFASELAPATGPGIRQGIGAVFRLWGTYLGDQWSIGDWEGMVVAAPDVLPAWMRAVASPPAEPPQHLKEYDPEWGRAFWTGSVAASCDHERMLRSVKVPVLFTHHFRRVDETTGVLMGAISDLQAKRALDLLAEAGVTADYRSFEAMGHSMHGQDPQLFTETLVDWVSKSFA
jgi:pimeloyl-ACP methyl ester carboxylesterase